MAFRLLFISSAPFNPQTSHPFYAIEGVNAMVLSVLKVEGMEHPAANYLISNPVKELKAAAA
jgi:hypothetical protein